MGVNKDELYSTCTVGLTVISVTSQSHLSSDFSLSLLTDTVSHSHTQSSQRSQLHVPRPDHGDRKRIERLTIGATSFTHLLSTFLVVL